MAQQLVNLARFPRRMNLFLAMVWAARQACALARVRMELKVAHSRNSHRQHDTVLGLVVRLAENDDYSCSEDLPFFAFARALDEAAGDHISGT